MKTVEKWNFAKQDYEEHIIPEEWNTPLHTDNMNEYINCAECGKVIKFGEAYTSRKIHNRFGLGYPVCESCYKEEWNEEKRYV